MLAVLKEQIPLLVYPGFALVCSLILTWICIRILPMLGYVDIPHGRHLHEKTVPRGGGIAIILSFFMALFLFFIQGGKADGGLRALFSEPFLKGFTLPALIIIILGLLDDRFSLRSLPKFLVQLGVGVLVWFQGNGFQSILGFQLPGWVALPLTAVWTSGVINAYNLVDGLDGIAAGLAAVSSFCIALWLGIMGTSPEMTMILLIFCASCLGFLRYNFHPAKIFMGDTGSTFIGFMFAFVSMQQATGKVTLPSMLLPILAIGLPLFDEFLAIWRRLVRKYIRRLDEKEGIGSGETGGVMTADTDHLHHRLFHQKGDQRRTAFTMYLIAFFGFLWAACMVLFDSLLPGLVYLTLLGGVFMTVRLANIEMYDSITLASRGFHLPRKSLILTIIHPVGDMVVFIVGFLLVLQLFPSKAFHIRQLVFLLVFLIPYALLMNLNGLYRTFWLRAGINRLLTLIKVLFLSAITGYVVIYLFYTFGDDFDFLTLRELITCYSFFVLFTASIIFGERFTIMYLERFGIRSFFITNARIRHAKLDKVLVYGGGLNCRLYLRSVFSRGCLAEPFDIIGIVDDDKVLRGLNVNGFTVLGALDNLEEIYANTPFDRMVITLSRIREDRMSFLRDFAEKHHIGFTVFIHGELSAKEAEDKQFFNIISATEMKKEYQDELAEERKVTTIGDHSL